MWTCHACALLLFSSNQSCILCTASLFYCSVKRTHNKAFMICRGLVPAMGNHLFPYCDARGPDKLRWHEKWKLSHNFHLVPPRWKIFGFFILRCCASPNCTGTCGFFGTPCFQREWTIPFTKICEADFGNSYYSLWTSLQRCWRFGCWLPNLFSFQTFALALTGHAVAKKAIMGFQQVKEFSTKCYHVGSRVQPELTGNIWDRRGTIPPRRDK